jgi:DNA processing protein
MSLAVVVVEAAAESGSHITARLAADEGRDVCAVPGAITNPYSEGTKVLINDGARLVTSGWDVLGELGMSSCHNGKPVRRETRKLDTSGPKAKCSLQQQILTELQQLPKSVDQLATSLIAPVMAVQCEITLLELAGKIIKRGEKCVRT